MRLIAPLDRPITVEVCIGGRLLPGVANLWPEDRRCRGGSGRRGRPILWRGLSAPQHSHGQDQAGVSREPFHLVNIRSCPCESSCQAHIGSWYWFCQHLTCSVKPPPP